MGGEVMQQQPCATPCEVRSAQAYSLEFKHDGKDVDGYRVYLRQDGAEDVQVGQDIALSALQNGAAVLPMSAPAAKGTYWITVSAFNKSGERKSTPYQFIVIAPPTAPSDLKIYLAISIAKDGTVLFKIVDVSEVK